MERIEKVHLWIKVDSDKVGLIIPCEQRLLEVKATGLIHPLSPVIVDILFPAENVDKRQR